MCAMRYIVIFVNFSHVMRMLILFTSVSVIMQTNSLLHVLVLALVCVWSALGNDSLSPPSRPSAFRSPAQLRKYLKALNDYYAIVGRPR
jgi:hypothetical protein